MKIKYSEVPNLLQGMVELAKTKSSGYFIAKSSARNIRKLEEAGKDYDKARVSLVESFAVKENEVPKKITKDIILENGEAGKTQEYLFESDEVKAKVQKEVKDLYESEVEIDLDMIDEKYLEKIEDINGALVYKIEKIILPNTQI